MGCLVPWVGTSAYKTEDFRRLALPGVFLAEAEAFLVWAVVGTGQAGAGMDQAGPGMDQVGTGQAGAGMDQVGTGQAGAGMDQVDGAGSDTGMGVGGAR